MRLKTFQARNMAQALAEVRKVLGEDAIIVATVPAEDGRGVSAEANASLKRQKAKMCRTA